MSELSPTKQALVAITQLQARLDAAERARREPIAIVGMGCRYPGAAGIEAFWSLLRAGGDAVGDTPRDRWNAEAIYSVDASVPGTIVTRRGGFLDRLDEFDAAFFGISPREAPHVDPRQRLMLEIAWEALEDAGIPPDSLAGSRTGVFVATLTNDYDHLLFSDLVRADAYSGAGTANSVVANRLSYVLDLRGPSLSLDTACSGSLVALHLACESLRSGESTMALAGGVSVNLMAKSNVFFSRAGALSPNGACRTFDAAADGMVRSDGAGLVVLKTLTQAAADGDEVIAVIAGSAVNHDGRSNGIMAPNGEAQQRVLDEAYRRAGVDVRDVQYVEAHGTGTRLGDPIEVQALGAMIGARGSRPVVLGSVKTNIGHTEAAAGIAGVIKAALAMRHRELPPTAHFTRPNPLLGLDRLPFEVRTAVGPWPDPDAPLVAGVSAFGFGGTNAHVVLREAPPVARASSGAPGTVGRTVSGPPAQPAAPPFILPLSARGRAALTTLAADVRAQLERGTDAGDVCRSAAVHRMHYGERLAVTGDSAAALIDGLARVADDGSASGRTRPAAAAVAFVFSGQGSHWAGMTADLVEREPVFREALERCDRTIAEILAAESHRVSIVEELLRTTDSRLNATGLAQPAIFAVQVALAALWQSWGLAPAFVVGHSLGEIAAAHVAGALSLEDAARVVCERSRLMARTAGQGATAVVGLSMADTRRLVRELGIDADVAGANGAATTVVAGGAEAIATLIAALKSRNAFARAIPGVDIAFHSRQMDPLRGELVAALAGIRPTPTRVPMISTVTAARIGGEALDPEYWGRNLRDPFLFADALGRLVESGCTTIVEIAPHTVLGSAMVQHLRHLGADARVLASMRREQPALPVLLGSLAALYEAGVSIDWRAFHAPRGGGRTSLPHYPWQRQRYWFDQLPGSDRRATRERREADGHPLLGRRIDLAADDRRRHVWQIEIEASTESLSDHRVRGSVVLPAAAALEMATVAARDVWGEATEVADATFERALHVDENGATQLQVVLTESEERGELAVFARRGTGAWCRYVAAICRRAPVAPARSLDLEEIRKRCAVVVTPDEHYAAMAAAGLDYGPRYRVLAELHRGDDEVLARIPAIHVDTRFIVTPAVLDGAFQSVAAALDAGDESYLPASVAGWRVHGSAVGDLWCHARLRGSRGDVTLAADITLTDAQGAIVANVDSLVLQKVATATRQRGGGMLLEERWTPKPRAGTAIDTAPVWLLLADLSGTSDRLARRLQESGARVVIATVGPAYQRFSETRFQVRPGDRGDLERVLREAGIETIAVVHLWALDSRVGDIDASALTIGALQAVQVAAVNRGTIAVVTRNGQATGDVDVEPQQASLSGLALVVGEEHPELRCRLIDLDRDATDVCADELFAELGTVDGEPRVALRDRTRLVPRLHHVEDETSISGSVTLRADATYLITGGTGALGVETAVALADAGARHLLLTSRRGLAAMDAAASQRLQTLAAAGVSVTIEAIDVAAADAAARLTRRLQDLPPLAGIIHAAGVLDDAPVVQQDGARVATVFGPKVNGAWTLHELSAALPLDFFIVYSSAASLIGSAGQANYAAANAFLDALVAVRRRRGLPALSINWGAWESGGMAARGHVRTRLAARGVSPIAVADGVRILRLALGNPPLARFGVMPVDWARFASQCPGAVPPLFDALVPARADAQSAGAWRARFEVAPPDTRIALIESLVSGELAAVLGFATTTSVDVRDGFFDLGMDSLTAVEFRNRLQARAGVPLSSTLAFDHANVAAVTTYLHGLLVGSTPPSLTIPAAAADLDAMSDEELAAELARELDEDLV